MYISCNGINLFVLLLSYIYSKEEGLIAYNIIRNENKSSIDGHITLYRKSNIQFFRKLCKIGNIFSRLSLISNLVLAPVKTILPFTNTSSTTRGFTLNKQDNYMLFILGDINNILMILPFDRSNPGTVLVHMS